MAYTGTSIVDYLKSIGQDSSYSARSALASQYGITNYTGSADQNLQLLNALKTSTSPTTPPTTTASPITTQAQQDLENVLAEIQKRQEAGTFTPTESQTAVIRQAQEAIPKSVTNVSQLGTTPTLPPDATSTTYPQVNVLEATSVSDYIQKQQEKLEAERATAQAALSKAGLTGTGTSPQEQLFTGYLEKAPVADYQKALQEAQAMYGVTEGLAELKLQSEKVAQLKGEIEKLEIQRQNELDVANKRLASMTSIQAEKNAINERYDSQRVKLVGDYNVEAAILAAKSNNLSEANKLVQYAVQAYTADITAEINRFNNLYSLASDWIDSLNAQEKSILDDAKAELIRERDLEEKRLNNVLNLKLQYPNAGINPTDTLEEALNKVAEYEKAHPETEAPNVIGSADTGYFQWNPTTGKWETTGVGGGTISTTQKAINNDAAEFILKLEAGTIGWGAAFDAMKALHPELSNERIDQLLGKEKRYGYEGGGGDLSKWEIESAIWNWLANEGSTLSSKEKKQRIMEAGLDPSTFNIY